MNYKKYISISTHNYIFICIGILLLFIIINFLFKKDNNENFNSISEYPKKFIEDNCNIYLKSYLKGKNSDFCENSAFVKDGNLLKNLCDVNGTFQILEVENNNDKKQFFGCDPNQNNLLGLKWENPNLENIPHQLYSVPAIFYNLYFNNEPYKGTWEYKNTIGQINCDGSNFFKINGNNNIGNWSSLNMKNTKNYSISFWLNGSTNSIGNILQISNNGQDCLYQQCNYSYLKTIKKRRFNYFKLKWEKAIEKMITEPYPLAVQYGQRQPMINIENNKMQITAGTTSNYNNSQTLNFPSFNNFNGLSHIIYNFKETTIDIYVNGELIKTLNMGGQIIPISSSSTVFIANQYLYPSDILIKNMIFWDANFNKIYAKKLYNTYLPLIREVNKIKILGKKTNSNEESFKTPFKLNKRLCLGSYQDLDFYSNNSITISFTINVKKNYSDWVNIMLITTNNFNSENRNPGIWLWPNKCALTICRSTDYYWNENMNYDFPLNENVHFKIVFDANSKKIILYKNKNWISPIIHQCNGNFNNISKDYRVWIATNSFGENVEISNFEIEGDAVKP